MPTFMLPLPGMAPTRGASPMRRALETANAGSDIMGAAPVAGIGMAWGKIPKVAKGAQSLQKEMEQILKGGGYQWDDVARVVGVDDLPTAAGPVSRTGTVVKEALQSALRQRTPRR